MGVNVAKSDIYEGLMAADGARGKVHLSRHVADEEYLAELTAEIATEVVLGTEQFWQFSNPHQKRNEALDGAVYARAAKMFSRPNFEKLKGNLDRPQRDSF